jgi:hypothetical protein
MKKIFLSLVLAVFVSVGAVASNGEINAKIGRDVIGLSLGYNFKI